MPTGVRPAAPRDRTARTSAFHHRLRKLFKEIDRLAKCLQCYDFRHDYVHLYTHTMESATALHGDDNLTFDNKKQSLPIFLLEYFCHYHTAYLLE